MRRASLYSSSRRPRKTHSSHDGAQAGTPGGTQAGASSSALAASDGGERSKGSRAAASAAEAAAQATAATSARPSRFRRFGRIAAPGAGVVAGAALVLALQGGIGTPSRQLTQEDIDSAVLNTLETQQLPSPAAKAAAIIGPSVVRVQAFGPEEADSKSAEADKGRAKPQKDAAKDAAKDPRKEPQKSVKEESKEGPKDGPKEVQKGVGTGVVSSLAVGVGTSLRGVLRRVRFPGSPGTAVERCSSHRLTTG